MRIVADRTFDQLKRGLLRYRPFIVTLVGVALVGLLLPAPNQDDGAPASVAASGPGTTVGNGSVPSTPGTSSSGTTVGNGSVPSTPGTSSSGTTGVDGAGIVNPAGSAPASGSTGRAGTLSGGGATPSRPTAPAQTGGAGVGPDCDSATGRIRIVSRYAPPCVPPFSGDNGGRTHRGVTADTITIAVYQAESSPAVEASLNAVGVTDTREETDATYRGFVELHDAHYEMYGRRVKLVFVQASGRANDDAAGKADAIRVATEIGAFASFGAPNEAYVAELAARGVMCICTVLGHADDYARYGPYRWGPDLMTASQNYVHLAEYVAKRLAGHNAVHAGDPALQTRPRTLGLIYLEGATGSGGRSADDFERLLAQHNVRLTARLSYEGDLARAQEQASTLIAKLKSEGVTSVMCMCDPLSPAFFTKEATNQRYFPEWVVTGYFLTDAAVFARAYDQQQWSNAFGIAQLIPIQVLRRDSARMWTWHFGTECPADDSCQAIYDYFQLFYTGVHLAGPNLIAETFQQAMYSYPSPTNGPTQPFMNYGPGGELWPFVDHSWIDDMAELWWDPTATGPDETGTQGVGLYRWVDGAKRYAPGQWPTGPPAAFQTEGTIFEYEEAPPEDQPPPYEHKHY